MARKVLHGKALVAQLRAQAGVRDPEALAAYLGRYKKARKAGLKPGQAKRVARGSKPSSKPDNTKDSLRERNINAALSRIANKHDHEEGFILDATTGEILEHQMGTIPNQEESFARNVGAEVNLREAENRVYDRSQKSRGELITAHNHPKDIAGTDSAAFSVGDFRVFNASSPHAEELVVTPRHVYRAKKPAENPRRFNNEEIQSIYERHMDEMFGQRFSEWAAMPEAEGYAHLYHEVAKATALDLGWSYSREDR